MKVCRRARKSAGSPAASWSAGNALADGRNEAITYTAPASGTYYVKLSAQTFNEGDYVLDPVESGGALPARGDDRAIGNARGELLIASSTAFGGNEAAFAAILAGRNPGRRDDATSGVNLMGTASGEGVAARLEGGDSPKITVQAAATMQDAAAEELIGTSSLDRVFAHLPRGLLGRRRDLSAAEFANDLSVILP